MLRLTDTRLVRRSVRRSSLSARALSSSFSLARRSGLIALAAGTLALVSASVASAGTYPMYQCSPGTEAVSPGWSVFGYNTNASTVLWNTCSAGGAIGDYVSSDEQAGAVTENGHSGSQVGLALDVPGSAPDVSIQSIGAEVIGSSVTGDDAFMGFTSAGQALPGEVELPYGGSNYTASESWSLPQGARDFEVHVNCTTDMSSPTCAFADSISVPALTDITLTLADNTPPAVTSVSGLLASAAAANATVSGSQAISFTASDADSGVRSATLTLSPQNGGAPSVHTFSFASECTYDAWNACPVTQTVSGFPVNTTALTNGAYAVELSITDAAGNVTNDALGSVTVDNPSTSAGLLGAAPGAGAGATANISAVGLGAPNGTDASEAAQLHLGASRITRAFAHRGLRLAGRLLSPQEHPIGNASLDVLEETAGTATFKLIGHATTRADGTFVAGVPAGPSRVIEVAYRAFSADAVYAAVAKVEESVSAGVQLSVSPSRTGAEGTITLSGKVEGPVPRQGVVVDLLVHYRGRWEPFRTPRTNSHGAFRVVYQFEGGVGRFPFRALAFGGQSGFPFSSGESGAVDVTTN
jgi:hypothetical protein